ncbi:9887_t:CDS:2 [Racocetra persica]|uniref:9887_t:CDS:1 n=1 Tax=Racocetra persica TaxID=160502 RepID=A0ACA9P3A0_9GLOM|nr:9887_t:CDS:2 [Racocetra persica]
MYIQDPEYNKEFNEPEEVLNLSTNCWIKRKGKLYNRLLYEGYKYARDHTHYLEDILPIDLDEYGEISLFTIERNRKTSLDNLIEMNYSSLSVLLEMCWDSNKARE